jgi:hypothetical protein
MAVGARGRQLADLATVGGAEEMGRAEDTLEVAQDIEELTRIVRSIGRAELDRGLAIARISGELSAVSRVIAGLDMPLLAVLLDDRSAQLQAVSVETLIGSQGTRLVAGALEETAEEVELVADREAASGIARLAVGEALAARSEVLASEGLAQAAAGATEMEVGAATVAIARGAAADSALEVAAGAADAASGETELEMADALAARAAAPKRRGGQKANGRTNGR